MVFKTMGDEYSRFFERMGVFGKSFSDIAKTPMSNKALKSFKDQYTYTSSSFKESFIANNLGNATKQVQKQAVEYARLINHQNLYYKQLQKGKITQEQYDAAITASNAKLKALTAQTDSLTFAQKASAAASKLVVGALNLFANVGISLVISSIISKIYEAVNSQKELREAAIESANSIEDQSKAMNDLVSQYKTIVDSEKTESEKTEELNEWKQTLAETYKFEKDNLEKLNLEREKGIELLNNEIESVNNKERSLWLVEKADQFAKAKEQIENGWSSTVNSNSNLLNGSISSDFFDPINEKDIRDSIKGEFNKVYELGKSTVFDFRGKDLIETYDNLQEILSKFANAKDLTVSESILLENLKKEEKALKKVLDEYLEIYNIGYNYKASTQFTEYAQNNPLKNVGRKSYVAWREGLLATADGDTKLEDELLALAEQQFPDYAKYFENLESAKQKFMAYEGTNKFNFLAKLSPEDLETALKIPDLFRNGLDGASELIEEFKKKHPIELDVDTESIDEIAEKIANKTKLIKSAMTDMRDSGYISSATYAELVKEGGNFTECLEVQNGKLVLNIQKLKELEAQEYDNAIAANDLAIAEMQASINSAYDYQRLQEKINELKEQKAFYLTAKEEILGVKPDDNNSGNGGNSTSEEPAQVTKFKKELAEKQHLVAMKELSEEDYLNWLDGAYKEAYAGLTGYEDDLYKYEEEIFSKRKELAEKAFDDTIDGIEKEIDTLEKLKDDASIDADKIIDPKATEELKKFNEEMQKTFGLGNVDLTKRPKVDAETMRKAGYDTEDGEVATVYSSTEFIWQGDDKNGKYVAVHYTPILPDGTVLDDESLRKYLYETLESSQDILDTDKNNLGIVLKVDTDFNISDKDIQSLETDKPTQNIQDIIKACDDWDVALHEVQEQWMELDDKIANSNVNNGDNIYEIIDKQISLYNNAIAEIDKRIAELEASGLVGIEDEIKELNKQKDDLLDKVYNLSKERTSIGVDNEIKYWEEMQSKQNEFYDKQIERLKEQKKLLEDKNDEEEKAKDLAEKQLELRKAQIALEDARRNRNVLVYTAGGGYSYEADQTAIAEAEEDVKKARKELAEFKESEIKKSLDKQIETLEDQKDKNSKYYDTVVKLLEDMSGKNKVQSNSNRDIWDELLSTEAGQNALANIDSDKLQELLDSGFLVQKDGKYSLGETAAIPSTMSVADVVALVDKTIAETSVNNSSVGYDQTSLNVQAAANERSSAIKNSVFNNSNVSQISISQVDVQYAGESVDNFAAALMGAVGNRVITLTNQKVSNAT